ncbi:MULTISPECIES: Bro-N domain-containing protein [unclassified Paenibacillus]|uniref:BRO-N domain-containing protein n=1 Tax=unclassified Paenibacillus TaxID=185978 RepID=UPI002405A221|nr:MULTISPECIES: Bro-N domain-containing protein [unclassified Paenibacillus]MDF9844586.1 prophage antirepressor-like protein [Paenibacillus sp. PastF-2]MDF9851236.1 prophage antirepressor-like protein [Paenibacillus sp. PastM-2]MDF9857771.1 prophage antirepressor-like protein [Paenibacillus sp. PastF-1]MDH6483085.1 prophage antirepressor-like protein [Paenibacillus sp. PastH-2]MDH6510451.1 prophage antirepressor-like protein [Paenibacillus sp. PastM-3]
MKLAMQFEGKHSVLTLLPEDVNIPFKGDFIISAKDVAAVLEYQGEKATANVLKFCKEEHIYLVSDSNLLNRNVRKIHNTGEKFISNLSLNRVLGQSDQPKAIPFQDWIYEDMLPSVQKTGQYTLPGSESQLLHFKKEAYMVEVTANVLRLPESGRLKLLGDFNHQHGLSVPLPGYAVDEPITESATELLKKHAVGIQTKAFNVLLLNCGILEEKERPSSKGGIKTFKSLTDAGLAYGKNIISPNSPRETAPHYYPDKFPFLLEAVGLRKELTNAN